jgi:hypothetical protein
MGLFFDLLSSINNPDQQGSIDQLSAATNALQQVASTQGIDANQMQSLMTALGGALGPALKQQQGLMGGGTLENLVGQIASSGLASELGATGFSSTALGSAIPPQIQQQITQAIAQKTGINSGMIQAMLPQLLPAVMGFLNMGSPKPGAGGGNPLLSAFLDGSSGSSDLGEVMRFAGRFLNPPANPA